VTDSEVERQVVAAADRYREIAGSHEVAGLPEAGRHVAAKAIGRAIQLLSFVLKRAAAAGVGDERLSELTGWDPQMVRELRERPPEPEFVSRVAPAGVDPAAVARAAASAQASHRLHELAGAILADVDDERWSPAAADLDELHDRLESAWRVWRAGLRGPSMEYG
jgi:hypothetical protein